VFCSICQQKLVYLGGGTSNIARHLKQHDLFSPQTQQSYSTLINIKIEKINDALVNFIVQHLMPDSIVEMEGFRTFCNLLNPNFKLPCRQTISDRNHKF